MVPKIVIALAIAFLGVVSCGTLPLIGPALTQADSQQDECRPGGSELTKDTHTHSGVVRVIRLTDDGELANCCELTDAIYEVRNYRGPEIVVWYVHGWKHNADQNNPDLVNFQDFINALDKEQGQLTASERRRVVGLYIGWDGAVGPTLVRNLTFWDRMEAADRISQSSIVTKVISAVRYTRMHQGDAIAGRDLSIMIGHSFGARILYTATSQVLIDEVQRRHPGNSGNGYHQMTGPADLIMLLNPAFEASVFTAMHSIRRPATKAWERIHERQQPLLLTISTNNDWATGTAFPAGQWLGGARGVRQRTTLGNYDRYITHELQVAEQSTQSSTCSAFWYDCYQARDVRLTRTAETQPGNPFLVARTTANIIDGHNGIWGDKLKRWMVDFVLELERQRTSSR